MATSADLAGIGFGADLCFAILRHGRTGRAESISEIQSRRF